MKPNACAGKAHVYDHLIDVSTPAPAVILEATNLCHGCPNRTQCWEDNATEPWIQQLTTPRARRIIRNAQRAQQLANPNCACGALRRPNRRQCARCRKAKAA